MNSLAFLFAVHCFSLSSALVTVETWDWTHLFMIITHLLRHSQLQIKMFFFFFLFWRQLVQIKIVTFWSINFDVSVGTWKNINQIYALPTFIIMNQDHQKLQKNSECDYKIQEQNFLGFTLNGKFVTVVVVNPVFWLQ